jgi:AbrB family looped-hinge helix DNA binding protein
MTVTVKSGTNLSVPSQVQRRAGIKPGDRVELRVSGGIIHIIPELPSAAGEYTPAQRRVVDARLADARKGPYYGPFETAEDAVRFLRKEARKRRAIKGKA